MGLFSFLKNKFSKKGDAPEKEKKEEQSLETYSKGLEKSRKNFASRLDALSKRYAKVNSDYFEELEQVLIESDVGVDLSLRLIENLLDQSEKQKISDPKAINEMLVDNMFVDYATRGESVENEIRFNENGPTVLLVVGVNGVGKTTSIAKLAHHYQEKGKKVLLVAGDTFRAGATTQLKIWAERLNCPIVVGKENGDPASVAYDGCQYAKNNDIDLIIVDTAGRQQTKANLMQELAKINRVLGREIEGAPHDTFLIIDGTTGQNGVLQAKAFKEVTNLTGIVITKMDGTSKGGIILSIRDELGVPVRFIGLGERMEDLQEFDLDKYLYGLLLGESRDD
ncbi:MAG: signal recognition particle-docking protein FtsY [Bacilli bacterium]|nr:signal recognition particle-docking protein FtsY [Bacilli bacterium]